MPSPPRLASAGLPSPPPQAPSSLGVRYTRSSGAPAPACSPHRAVVLQLYRPHPVKTIVEGLKRYWKEICDLIFEDTSSGTHRQEAALFEEIWQASEATCEQHARVSGISSTSVYNMVVTPTDFQLSIQ
ncbi:hypothetical protein PAHAL_3G431800 [Panicum hallii]|uniref:Uncharacterized protein n=1 Tax=Panicum hallii TaxID=206008 RepID=A0A2S3HE33_9POAL|nr:hypothetical protein PAHAL_3G431800 [Panicum hallii]